MCPPSQRLPRAREREQLIIIFRANISGRADFNSVFRIHAAKLIKKVASGGAPKPLCGGGGGGAETVAHRSNNNDSNCVCMNGWQIYYCLDYTVERVYVCDCHDDDGDANVLQYTNA